MPKQTDAFTIRRVGISGCEIRDPDGQVIAWTVDGCWATVIVTLLNQTTLNNENQRAQLRSPDTNPLIIRY